LHTRALDALTGREAGLAHLPLVTLYLSERCNSRCVTCDYWRHGVADMSLSSVRRLLPNLARLHTQVVLISGGEPLINAEWPQIAELLRGQGLKLWLLTSGLSLAKHALRASALFDAITVSLDGTDRATYEAIRGVDAFDKVCEVSFLAVDVANPHAFARQNGFTHDLALQPPDLPLLAGILDELEHEHASEFRSGLIANSPRKLRRIHQYFAAVCGVAPYPAVRCNVFEYSAVIGATGRVSPCFFITGPPGSIWRDSLEELLNHATMSTLRASIRAGERPECARCVCSLWRDLDRRGVADFLPRGRADA